MRAWRLLVRLVRSPGGIVVLAVLLALTLRAPFVRGLAYPDEAGLLIVAGNWHEGGANLYGSLFVDRPPLLLLIYQFADALGGIEAARVLGLLAAATAVAAAGWIGHTLAGRRGTACSTLAAAALVANPMIGATEVNAELLGAPLTLLSIALPDRGAATRTTATRVATYGSGRLGRRVRRGGCAGEAEPPGRTRLRCSARADVTR